MVDEEMAININKKKLVDMYKTMLLIRHFEEKAVELVEGGKIYASLFLYRGEEAVAVGVCSNLRKDDYITSTHRGLGHAIAKGVPIKFIMAELFAKKTGTNKGKGGSMLIADLEVGHLGSRGIVGSGIPIAVGAGLSIKLRRTDQVCICYFGDGASNQGTFHESLNLAAIWKLPVVFVCENNMYGISTHVSHSTSVKDISKRAAAYGIPGESVDGMDVVAVYKAIRKAVGRTRKGGGPMLIECKTYRFLGHSGTKEFEIYGKPYRSREEIEEWKKRDPIITLRPKLFRMRVLTDESDKKMKNEIDREVEEAVKFAVESPDPTPEEALEGLFSE